MRSRSRSRSILMLIALLTTLSVVSIRLPAQKTKVQEATFDGEVMDEHCAQMGSHNMTMKANNLATPDLCTTFCIYFQQTPGKYVLLDATKKMIYQLDDQSQGMFFAGRTVRVTGTYDQVTKTIHVKDIKSAPLNS